MQDAIAAEVAIAMTRIAEALEKMIENGGLALPALSIPIPSQIKPKRGRKSYSAKEDYLGKFDAMWNIWPRKQGKEAAYKRYLRDQPEFPEDIMDIMAAQIRADYAKRDRQYVPYLASWIDNKGWLDPAPAVITAAARPQTVDERILEFLNSQHEFGSIDHDMFFSDYEKFVWSRRELISFDAWLRDFRA